MVLDSKIQKLRLHFGIWQPAEWSDVSPEDLLAIPDIGKVTVDHIRMYLAARDLTLKNDRTPEYWRTHLSSAKIVQQMGDIDLGEDSSPITPFTILVDTAETEPFTFAGIPSNADQDHKPWIVKTEWHALGRYPDSLGDYAISGMIGRCHIERKSLDDCHGTILGFKSGRRERFECELQNLSDMDACLVLVEASYEDVIRKAPETPNRSARANAVTLQRSMLSYMQDYRVQWHFSGSRRLAELDTFRWLERFWNKAQKRKKNEEKLVSQLVEK